MIELINKYSNITLHRDNIDDLGYIISQVKQELKQFKNAHIKTYLECIDTNTLKIHFEICQFELNTELKIEINIHVNGYIECIKQYINHHLGDDIRHRTRLYISDIISIRFMENTIMINTYTETTIIYVSSNTDFEDITLQLNLTANTNDLTSFMFANLNEYYKDYKALINNYHKTKDDFK